MDDAQYSSFPRGRCEQRGFTLIEIMVVVDIGGLMQALNLYRLDQGYYPSMSQGLAALVERPVGISAANWRPYLERLPKDPWGKPYQYLNPGANGEIDVFTLGADGQPNGEGVNSDIGSWQL